ncbi:hypothetical protein GALL_478270 [mine drainage metagenome]|uniref:Uncharacterized protein n=1 Tax=mine drainage metagenome TaxID=410659 RepID=A0A1J5PS34_9ZZZZ
MRDPSRAQGARDAEGALPQQRMAQCLFVADQRGGRGGDAGLFLQPPMHQRVGRQRHRGGGVERDEALAIGLGEDVQVGKCLVVQRASLAQQDFVAGQPALHGDRVEQGGRVLAFQPQTALLGNGVDEQLEVFEMPGIGHELRLQAGVTIEVQRLVQVEHHRRQRHARRVALDDQFLEQGAEGVVLVLEGIEHLGLHAAQRLGERHMRVWRQAQRQQVHAVAHGVLEAGQGLAGGGHADHHFFRARQPLQQRGERGEKRGKQAGALACAETPHLLQQIGRQHMVDALRGEAALRRACMVERQVEYRRGTGVTAEPIGFVAGMLGAFRSRGEGQ